MNDQPFESVRDLVTNLAGYIPAIVAGLAVLLLGLLAAWAVSHLLVRLLVLMRLDRVMARLRWTSALESADARHTLFELFGTVVGIFIFLVFVANALVIWKLTVLSDLFTRMLLRIPEIVAAVLILLVGWAIANLATRAVQQLLFREHFVRARLVSTLGALGDTGDRICRGAGRAPHCGHDRDRGIPDHLRLHRVVPGAVCRARQPAGHRTDVGGLLASRDAGS